MDKPSSGPSVPKRDGNGRKPSKKVRGNTEKLSSVAAEVHLEVALFYAGIGALLFGIFDAAYITRLLNLATHSAKAPSVTVITQMWAFMISVVSAFLIYLASVFLSYKRHTRLSDEALDERKTLSDMAPVGIFTYGKEGLVESVNPKMLEFWDVEEKDVIGKRNVFTFAPFVESGIDVFLRLGMDGTPRRQEIKIRLRPDSDYVWRLYHVSPVRRTGKPEKFMAIVEDITELKRLQIDLGQRAEGLEEVVSQQTGQLINSQKQLFAILENLPIILWVVDKGGVFTISMGRGLAGLGLEPSEVVGKTLVQLYGDQPQIIENHRRALSGEEVDWLTRSNERALVSHVSPLRDSKGVVIGVIGVALDVTEATKDRSKLFDNLALYRTLVELIPESIFIQVHGKIVSSNRAGAELFGVADSQAVIGKSLLEIVHRDFRIGLEKRIAKLKKGQSMERAVEKIVGINGKAFDAEVDTIPLEHEGKRAVLVIIRKISS